MFFGMAVFVVVVALLVSLLGLVVASIFSGLDNIGGSFLVGIGVLFVLAMIRRSFGRTWRPVQGLVDAAGKLADGDYTARVDMHEAPGARSVATSFNTLAERLEHSDEQRRRLMSDLSHELRTPLSVIRGEIEAVIDGVRDGGPEHMKSLLDEVELMEHLIEDLRVLALSEAGKLPLQLEPTDVRAVLSEIVDSYQTKASNGSTIMTLDAPRELPILDIDAVRLRQAVTNLLVNSMRAMPDGGSIRVLAISDVDGLTIDVIDTGTGIDPADLDTVFDRFTKAADSPGSGLGLSIARGLVRAHGGDLTIVETGPHGTTARVWLPL